MTEYKNINLSIIWNEVIFLVSPCRVIHFDTHASLHHVLKGSQSTVRISFRGTEMGDPGSFVLGMGLSTNWRSSVIGLILVNSSAIGRGSSCFRESPSWEVLFIWRIGWVLWHISSWTYWVRGWSLILQSPSTASSKTKCVLWWLLHLWTLFRVVLRTRGLF